MQLPIRSDGETGSSCVMWKMISNTKDVTNEMFFGASS